MKRKKQTKHTFRIESLLDKEGEYVGVFCAMTGELLHHEGQPAAQPEQPEEEIKPINPNQLNLFQ